MDIEDKKFREYLQKYMFNLFSTVSKNIILPYYNNLKDSQIEIKTDENDLVTLADKKTEIKISEQLQNDFRNVKIIGEEGMYSDKGNKNKIDNNYYWTIDPIDGTKNYVNNNKNFCSMIS